MKEALEASKRRPARKSTMPSFGISMTDAVDAQR
jgi:hypothetical protein